MRYTRKTCSNAPRHFSRPLWSEENSALPTPAQRLQGEILQQLKKIKQQVPPTVFQVTTPRRHESYRH